MNIIPKLGKFMGNKIPLLPIIDLDLVIMGNKESIICIISGPLLFAVPLLRTAQRLQMAARKSSMSGVILNRLQPKFAAKSVANEMRCLKAM